MYRTLFILLLFIILAIIVQKTWTKGRSTYALKESKSEANRLDFQNTLFQKILENAFGKAAQFKNIEGATIVDFGCGTSSAYADISKHIGADGTYIGIDASEKQLAFAKEKYPHIHYINGDETNPDAQNAISNADIVFMRYVVMHQPQPEAFVRHIYDRLKPGALLIILEPEEPEERKQEMVAKYPYTEALCDLKVRIGKGLGLDYNFAAQLEPILKSLSATEFYHNKTKVKLPMKQAKLLLKSAIKSMKDMTLDRKIVAQDELVSCSEAVGKLPVGPEDYWHAGFMHTFVLRK